MITSGGGFATSIPTPAYQLASVEGYFHGLEKSHNPSHKLQAGYQGNGRGYPDLALLSNNHLFLQGQAGLINGSSTVLGMAAMVNMVARVNDQRDKRLGWLNPLLYHGELGAAFTQDIQQGDNHCTGYYAKKDNNWQQQERRCCAEGFVATTGWDPVTGLGSVNFTAFLHTMLTYDEQHQQPAVTHHDTRFSSSASSASSTHYLEVLTTLLLGRHSSVSHSLAAETAVVTDHSSSSSKGCDLLLLSVDEAQVMMFALFASLVLAIACLLLCCWLGSYYYHPLMMQDKHQTTNDNDDKDMLVIQCV